MGYEKITADDLRSANQYSIKTLLRRTPTGAVCQLIMNEPIFGANEAPCEENQPLVELFSLVSTKNYIADR